MFKWLDIFICPSLGLTNPAFRHRQREQWGMLRYRKKQAVFVPLAALLLGYSFSAPAYTALVAFGDSYTDTGNAPSSPPNYWNGRFSNGPLWIEYLSQSLGFAYNPANNFAVSGTESNELGVEINKFAGTTDAQNVLFAIWSGNNDFGNHLNIGYNDAAWDTQINGIVSSLMTASDLLYQKGARSILLFNQIDLTRVPYILNNGGEDQTRAEDNAGHHCGKAEKVGQRPGC
jgi:phospholipase/lecithinase/hemolysin